MAKTPQKIVKTDTDTQRAKIPGVFWLSRQSLGVLARNWKMFGTIVLWYALLNVVLVQGFNAFGSLSESKTALDQLFTDGLGRLTSGAELFVYLIGASGSSSNPTAGVYQFIFLIIFSLAIIWLLRQAYGGQKVRARDGLYSGMAPLVPFVLVLAVVVLQLLPLGVGALLYSTVVSAGLAVGSAEQLLWTVVLCALAAVSLYLVASSLFALYVSTLPDMTPLRALRSARQLVRNRRWTVLRKILFLPVALVVVSGLVVIPFILFLTPIAGWVFFAVSMVLLPVAHSYMYTLYRSLL